MESAKAALKTKGGRGETGGKKGLEEALREDESSPAPAAGRRGDFGKKKVTPRPPPRPERRSRQVSGLAGDADENQQKDTRRMYISNFVCSRATREWEGART